MKKIFFIILIFILATGGVFFLRPRFIESGQPPIIELLYLTVYDIGTSHTPGSNRTSGSQVCQVGAGSLDVNCLVGTPCSCDAGAVAGNYYRIEFQVANKGATADTFSGYYADLGNLLGTVVTASDIWISDDAGDETCNEATWADGRLTWPQGDSGCIMNLDATGDDVDEFQFIIQVGSGASTTSGADLYALEDGAGGTSLTAGVEITVAVALSITAPTSVTFGAKNFSFSGQNSTGNTFGTGGDPIQATGTSAGWTINVTCIDWVGAGAMDYDGDGSTTGQLTIDTASATVARVSGDAINAGGGPRVDSTESFSASTSTITIGSADNGYGGGVYNFTGYDLQQFIPGSQTIGTYTTTLTVTISMISNPLILAWFL